MEPVTVTITNPYELASYQRARCHRLAVGIRNLADDSDLGDIADRTDDERLPELLVQLEAALAALEAIHAK
jgi:hypothetical protein